MDVETYVGIITNTNWTAWQKKVQALLESNQIQVGRYRFTRPAPMVYEHQWLWDSAFHAIIYRWFDPAMARDELLSDVAHQLTSGDDEGMIPHMSYWRGGGTELWGNESHSIITQPPIIGTAARLVYERTADLDLLQALYPPLVRYHEWFDRRRDPDGDHLISILHPWESWDASPRWDKLLGLKPFSHESGRQARMALAARIREYNGDAVALARDGYFHVEPVDVNAIRAADLEALAFIAAEVGDSDNAQQWQDKAKAVQRAVSSKLIGNEGDSPHDLAGEEETPIRVESTSDFIALFGGCATPQQAEWLVKRLQDSRYWTPYPIPTTPTNSADFAPDVYWRGNVWMQVNWLVYMGLKRSGYHALARDLAARSLQLVEENGFWEFFDPLTGTGGGASPQSWTALVLDMLAQERNL